MPVKKFCTSIALSLLILVCSFPLQAQIIIKDSVSISPSPLKNNLSPQATSSMPSPECVYTNYSINFGSIFPGPTGYPTVTFTINGVVIPLIQCNVFPPDGHGGFKYWWDGTIPGYGEDASMNVSSCYVPPAASTNLTFEIRSPNPPYSDMLSYKEIWSNRNNSYPIGYIVTYPLGGPRITITNPIEETEEVRVSKENKPVITIQAEAPEVVGSMEYFPTQTISTKDYFNETTGEFVVPPNQEKIYYPYPWDKFQMWIDAWVKGYNQCGFEGRAERRIKLVSKKSCPMVKLSSSCMKPADTINVTVLRRYEDGTTEEYPQGTKFAMEVTEGYDYGNLLVNGVLDYYFEDIEMPIQFVAASEIDANNVMVTIRADLIPQIPLPEGGTTASVKAANDTIPGATLSLSKHQARMNAAKHANQTVNAVGCYSIANVTITREECFDHFKVMFEKDTVAHGESSMITATAKNAQDNDTELDGNTLLTLTIDSTQYGNFISATGDTVSSLLENVLYSDAKDGKIKFTANKTNPIGLTPRRVIVTITKADNMSKTGNDTVFVKGKIVVKIQEHAPWTVWPYLPPQNNPPMSRGADRPGYNPKRTFSILVQDGLNRPIKGDSIKIFTKYETNTGGHGHKGFVDNAGTVKADTSLPQNLQGVFYGEKKNGNPLQLTTDNKGIASVDSFRASEASGKYLITARSVTDTTALDTVNMQIRVPDFVEFSTGDYWTLTGTTSNRGKNHLSNHWCTQATKDSIISALKKFYEYTASEAGGGKGIKLGINDMCLEWGGAFDIPGQWTFGSQHSFHRVGLSVDIDNDPGDLRLKDGTLTKKGKRLKEIMEGCGAKKYDEDTIHFGFDKGI